MKVELHLHTHRYSPCARLTPAEAMERLIATGYDAVYLTEHNAVWSDWEVAHLAEQFPDIRIFPGVEVAINPSSTEGFQHLLVLGTHDACYIELAEKPADLLAKARNEGCLTVLAHPYRWSTAARMLDAGRRPDAIEGLTCNHEPAMAQRAMLTSAEMGIPLVHAGDVHAMDFIDRYWIETDRPIDQATDIREIILGGHYRNCTSAD